MARTVILLYVVRSFVIVAHLRIVISNGSVA